MLVSRKVDDLVFPVKKRALNFIHACKEVGIDLLVTCTLRDAEAQDALYAQGRTEPGRKVTNARGGSSCHQYGVALDVVPMRNGKPVWTTSGADGVLWRRIGEIGESCGLEWAGRWATFPEFPHFQFTNGLSIADFKAGKAIPNDLPAVGGFLR